MSSVPSLIAEYCARGRDMRLAVSRVEERSSRGRYGSPSAHPIATLVNRRVRGCELRPAPSLLSLRPIVRARSCGPRGRRAALGLRHAGRLGERRERASQRSPVGASERDCDCGPPTFYCFTVNHVPGVVSVDADGEAGSRGCRRMGGVLGHSSSLDCG